MPRCTKKGDGWFEIFTKYPAWLCIPTAFVLFGLTRARTGPAPKRFNLGRNRRSSLRASSSNYEDIEEKLAAPQNLRTLARSLHEDVESLVFDEGRFVGTKGNDKAERILARSLKAIESGK